MKRKEILIIIGLIILGITLYIGVSFFGEKEEYDLKNGKGEVLFSFNLSEDNYFEVEGDYGIFHLEIKDGYIRAIDVDCPNHDCEKVGFVKGKDALRIICLPNNLAVTYHAK